MPKQLREYLVWVALRNFAFVGIFLTNYASLSEPPIKDLLFAHFPIEGWVLMNGTVGFVAVAAAITKNPMTARIAFSLGMGVNLMFAGLLIFEGAVQQVVVPFIVVLLLGLVGKDFAMARLSYADPEMVEQILDREADTDMKHEINRIARESYLEDEQ